MTNEEFIESIRLKGEEWRDVVGYEGYYMVSSLGRVISTCKKLNRRSKSGNQYTIVSHPRLLKQQISNRGYYIVMLTNNYKRDMSYVHRLVAEAFIPNPNHKPQVDHIDTNRLNSRIDNLRWCTQSENNLNEVSNNKFRKSRTGKSATYKWIPIVSISTSGTITHYNNITSVQCDGHLRESVTKCLKGKRLTHHCLKWMYLSDYEFLISMSKNSTEPSAN